MHRSILTLLAGLAAVQAGAAQAADRPPLRAAIEPEAEVIEAKPLGSGWYLRGDAGRAAYGSVKDVPHGISTAAYDRTELDDAFTVGAGVGFRLNPWLRVDLTADYRSEARLKGLSSATRYTLGYSLDQGAVESTTYLVNAYLDLGTWGGITPYLGGGIGLAHNHVKGFEGQKVYFGQAVQPPPDPYPNGDHFNFAYALMAGMAVEMGSGVSLDGGYRYVNLGSARTGLDAYGVGTRVKDLEAHEARLGLRWSFLGEAGPRPVRAYSAPLTNLR